MPMPTHVYSSNAFLRRIFKPVLNQRRSPGNNAIQMGGNIVLDTYLSTWISQRRSIEMEKIN